MGFYAGYDKAALSVNAHLDYGKQTNAATRCLQQLGLQAGTAMKKAGPASTARKPAHCKTPTVWENSASK